jgi:hypothetical protein
MVDVGKIDTNNNANEETKMSKELKIKGFSGKIAYGYFKNLNGDGRNVWVVRHPYGTIEKCLPDRQNLNGAAATARFINTDSWS